MTPFPGTELWEKAGEYGTFSYSRFSDLALSHKPTFIPKGLNKEKLIYLHKKAYRDTYLNPNMILRQLKGIDNFIEVKRLWSAVFSFLAGQRNDQPNNIKEQPIPIVADGQGTVTLLTIENYSDISELNKEEMNRKDAYLRLALEQIPRLLGLLDKVKESPTYGCFDRQQHRKKIVASCCKALMRGLY